MFTERDAVSIAARPGMIRFDGQVRVFYMTICKQCDIALPHSDEVEQKRWAAGHSTTGHPVTLAVDVAPDPAITAIRQRALLGKLRDQYGRISTRPVVGCSGCPQMIIAGDRIVEHGGRSWHVQCIDDVTLVSLASMADIMPNTTAPATKTGAGWATLGINLRKTTLTDENISDPLARLTRTMTGIVDAVDGLAQPKKMNARERRRLKREGKQRAR